MLQRSFGFLRIAARLAEAMSHHYSGPDFGFPRGDARLDLTDLYAFPKPRDASKSILIFDAHPSSSVVPIAPTTNEPFSTEARYELLIDTNGDSIADITYRTSFVSDARVGQTATLKRIEGNADDGEIIIENAPVSRGRDAFVSEGRGLRFFAGWRSDPFFFDVLGALDGLRFTGDDFFADKDICSIALEIPNATFGGKPIGLWMRSLIRSGDRWIQVERGARPQIAVFLAGEARDAYQVAQPADDGRFIDVFAHALENAGGYTPNEAARVANQFLPDIMRYDPSRPAAYPTNGRALTDNVVDFLLPILTNGKIKTEKVGPHRDLIDQFPYVGPPHRERA